MEVKSVGEGTGGRQAGRPGREAGQPGPGRAARALPPSPSIHRLDQSCGRYFLGQAVAVKFSVLLWLSLDDTCVSSLATG